MKGKSLMLTALLSALAGVLLIIFRNDIHSSGVVITGGVLFIVAGLLNLLIFEHRGKKGSGNSAVSTTFSWLTCAASVILGLCMLIFQGTFAGLVPVMFGILILFAAVYQYFILAIGARPVTLPGWLYIIPTAMVGGAVYVFLRPEYTGDMPVVLTAGISFVLFGVASVIEAAMLGHYHRNPEKVVEHTAHEVQRQQEKESDAHVEDVEAKEDDIPVAEPVKTPADHRLESGDKE
ncbi:MAG: DUF308 domain-containing protein [Muribaculaceae bacterium]|nr:DUF308 domain-containing protein [Muribaculaceae bacterium]